MLQFDVNTGVMLLQGFDIGRNLEELLQLVLTSVFHSGHFDLAGSFMRNILTVLHSNAANNFLDLCCFSNEEMLRYYSSQPCL